MKKQVESESDYRTLCQELWRHNSLYYHDHCPEITDYAYDLLLEEIVRIEESHPEWVYPGSPTQRVGESLTEGFSSVAHFVPMLSLENTYSQEEIRKFIERIEKWLSVSHAESSSVSASSFSVELKMDGTAVSVFYERGLFVRAVTRGNGLYGDDVTGNVRTIRTLPLQLTGEEIPPLLEMRGEIFMEEPAFLKLNREREERGEEAWSNPRNAAAGSLKLLSPEEVAQRPLSIVFYCIQQRDPLMIDRQSKIHAQLERWGLPTLSMRRTCCSFQEIWDFAEEVREKRSSLPFAIDGIVIKWDDLSHHASLGSRRKSPRWAIAYKFPPEEAVTRVESITMQVGRTGILTPVAELQPITLSGSIIRRATLHNSEEVQRKDVRVGDWVTIAKGGDVIPKIVTVLIERRSDSLPPFSLPAHCPSCGVEVIQEGGSGVAIRCPNRKSCPQQQLKRLEHFVSRDAMHIENLGVKILERLIVERGIQKASDLYTLQEEDLQGMEGFQEKSVKNILFSIERSKEVSLDRFLFALEIPHVGKGMAETLAQRVDSVEELSEYAFEDLCEIDSVGKKSALSIVQFFEEGENMEEIHSLLKKGVHPHSIKSVQKEERVSHLFSGKTFVLTGTLSHFSRREATEKIGERGGRVVGSIGAKTDYLLAGDSSRSSPSAKRKKAEQLGIAILGEEQFKNML